MTKVNDRSEIAVDYDPDVDVYHAEFDRSETSASTAVVSAVAAVQHCNPMDLEPLYHSIDTDALDAIIAQSEGNRVTVSLVANDVDVSVGSDGTIEIELPEAEEI